MAELNRQHVTRSEEQTHALAQRLARQLRPGHVIALNGPLGAGKTAFVRGLVAGLGGDPGKVSSPTFVISQEYDAKPVPLVHVDAYRLAGADELDTIGWDEMLSARDSIIAVEWAERVAPAIPTDAIHVSIAYVADEPSQRAITITGVPTASVMRPCPICKTPTPSDSEFAPFCSRRCKLADLGRWLTGKYTISRPISERDIESQD